MTYLSTDLIGDTERIYDNIVADGHHSESGQVLCVVEEAGEFAQAYRRYKGLARKPGSIVEVMTELADVVIAAFVTSHTLGIDLDDVIEERMQQIQARGGF